MRLFQVLVLMSCFDKVSMMKAERGTRYRVLKKKGQFFSYLTNDSLTGCQITGGILFLVQMLLV